MYLGVDLGTSGVTALLLDTALQVVARRYAAFETTYPQPGWVEQDARALLAATLQVSRGVLDEGTDSSRTVAGLANPGESVLAWDARTGDPLTPVLVWSDTRSAGVCHRLRAGGHEPAILELSGLRLDPYFCAAKFAWLLENDRAVQQTQKAGCLRLCTLDAWINLQLSGRYYTDHSTASRTQLYSPRRGGWSPELLQYFGLPANTLPEIRPGLSALGRLQVGPHRVPWTAALLDQVAALIGNGCLNMGEAKVTYGTGAFVLAQAGQVEADTEGTLLRTVGLSSSQKREFIFDGGVYSAGSALGWLERLGVLPHPAEAGALAEQATGERLRFLPAFSGLGAPWWQAEARGVLSGLSGSSGPAEVTRAVLEGVAARVTDVLEALRVHLPQLERVRADGGLAQISYLMQHQADLSGLVVERSTEHEATALGMALVAGVSAGRLSWSQFRERTAGVEVFTPQWTAREREQERAHWRRWLLAAAALPKA